VKAAPFEYTRAASVEEAVALLAEHGDAAKPIAGGQSLVPMMAMRLARPAWLVDINRIPALQGVDARDGVVRVAACTRQCVVDRDATIAARVPLIPRALVWVGHVQTRNRGTVGGSLAHADPSAELPLVAQTLGAKVSLRSKTGTRVLGAAEFFAGPMMTNVDPTELVEWIDWPVWAEARTGAAFDEIGIRAGDFAIVAACAQVALDAAGKATRVAFGLGGVDQTPLAFPDLAARLVGTTLDDAAIAEVAAAAAQAIEPGEDMHATRAYRRHLARTLATRTLGAARDEARGKR
jgi:CO/xanthine dehydrogenase FAD-binding subunit